MAHFQQSLRSVLSRTPLRSATGTRVKAALVARAATVHRLYQHTMSLSTPYTYISASELAKTLKQQQQQQQAQSGSSQVQPVAVVDVRDDDYEGGHIRGCTHVPSTTFSDKVHDLVVGPLKDASQVVFHCSLSQARGPKAARMYSEARENAMANEKLKGAPEQKVQVLRDGFSNFGQVYKNDADLVEDYDEESWKYR